MGFSLKKMFSGSGWKKFKKIAGGVVSVASLAVPGLGVAGIAGKLLAAKGAVGKVSRLTSSVLKINKAVRHGKILGGGGLAGRITSTAAVLRASPVMPGGGVATPAGVGPPMINPPANYGGRGSSTTTRKRKPAKKRKTAKRRTTGKRKARKLKFGSPAYRKKYLGHR